MPGHMGPGARLTGVVQLGFSHLLRGLAGVFVLLLPVLLFRTRALADADLSVVAVLFLIRSAVTRDWDWLRARWVQCGLGLWGLMVLSSLLAGPRESVVQALVAARFFVFAAGLAYWVLVGARLRRMLGTVCALLAGWTILECWEQYLTGINLFGYSRWGDGALTGPFYKPKAGNALLMVLFPGLMPVVLRLTQQREQRPRLVGLGLLGLSLATFILIGQRMSTLLACMGLVLTALLVRRMRWPVLGALALGGAVLAALPVLSPPAYAKLVVRFSDQLAHFASSSYGQIYARAGAMITAHPWFGLGFDGFRLHCLDPRYLHGFPALGLSFVPPATEGCNLHPHNYYLQVATAAGLPGLVLFLAMIGCWFALLVRPHLPARGAERVSVVPDTVPATTENAMLLVACCVQLWPLASTSALFSLPSGGWVFLIAGWGLAAVGAEGWVRPKTGWPPGRP